MRAPESQVVPETIARTRPRETRRAQPATRQPAKIYYIHPALAGRLEDWPRHLERCRALGFDHVGTAPLYAPGPGEDIFLTGDHEAAAPSLGVTGRADDAIAAVAALCARHGLKLILDLVIGSVDRTNPVAAQPGWFHSTIAMQDGRADPRVAAQRRDSVTARFDDPDTAQQLIGWWHQRLSRHINAGAAGFRCVRVADSPAWAWRALIAAMRETSRDCRFLAWTPGLTWPQIASLSGAGFDGVFSSDSWWDYRGAWFAQEHEVLRAVAPVLACPEAPFGPRLASRLPPGTDPVAAYRRALRVAAATGHGILVPMGFEYAARRPMDGRFSTPQDLDSDARIAADLAEEIRDANALADRMAAFGPDGALRSLSGSGAAVTALLRADAPDPRQAGGGAVVLINPDLAHSAPVTIGLTPLPPSAGAAFALSENGETEPLMPAEVRALQVRRIGDVEAKGKAALSIEEAVKQPRIVIEAVSPSVDQGRFAAKRVVATAIAVEADIFIDGHDKIAACVLWKADDETAWHRAPMRLVINDRWRASITPSRIGRHTVTIEAWWDRYASLMHDLARKREAGVAITNEIDEARQILQDAAGRAERKHKRVLTKALDAISRLDSRDIADLLLSDEMRASIAACDEHAFLTRHEPALPIEIERPQVEFASWYELFPRSQSGDRQRHGTFADVIARLPAIRAMGFDVLYFPPIHPIGTINRKGRNNSLTSDTNDVGSPYAIGSAEGGHDAILSALGTFDDFRRLRDAAAAHGLELALDFAIQCSPDHPWLKQHPDWFRWRADGTIRYAENPPKKYEDIVNVDFYADGAIPDLWLGLRDIVRFWAGEGVRIFRVDNPHTKPLPFWEWLIADIRTQAPDIIFLSEAFTRPKMMYRLAKVGFSQSYTYFIWRNTKQELTDYITELTTTDVVDFFRPHFFVNTPDINPYFLQTSGRGGFLIRAALATTLSGLWGVYSGFELCEAAALPGREEYLDSEKYELRPRDDNTPGNIIAEITMLNRLRQSHPALQTHLNTKFYTAHNDNILVYGKPSADGTDMILIAVSLDPHAIQEADFEVPLWTWKIPDHGSVAVEDLVHGHRFMWTGKIQHVRLDPSALPYAIWRIAPMA